MPYQNRNKTKVLIIDDHKMVVQGLTALLHKEPDFVVCGDAYDVQSGLTAIENTRPDIVIADLSLQDSHGLDLVKYMKESHPNVSVIVLSMHDETIYAERAIRAGAKGYIMKDESYDKVVDAIRAVTDGNLFFSDTVKEHLITNLTVDHLSKSEISTSNLSDRELEVFKLIGKGLRPRHIAEELVMSVRTVDTHCQRIRSKLNIKDMKELIHVASQHLPLHDK